MGQYETVVIDFPWEVVSNYQDKQFYRMAKQWEDGERRMPYKLMSDEEILNFPIDEFAASRCDLFLWSITSKIPFCFKIFEKWGFKYMDFIAWDKEIGVPVNGIYRRAEWVLYGYRGTMGIAKKGAFIPTVIREKRREHSQKPDGFYTILTHNTLSPRVDVFARKRHFGFDAWGEQTEQEVEVPLTEVCG